MSVKLYINSHLDIFTFPIPQLPYVICCSKFPSFQTALPLVLTVVQASTSVLYTNTSQYLGPLFSLKES